MKTTTRVLARILVCVALCVSLGQPRLSVAATLWESTRASGVWCEKQSCHAMTREHERCLELSLRRITGFGGLQFGSDGLLTLGESSMIEGGSAEARQILRTVVSSGSTFVVEDYSGSRSVTFGQAASEQIHEDRDGSSSRLWRLRLDFDDFREMAASPQVRAAFDEGLTFFHELLHGLGYKDASHVRELGECEEIVNRVRSELGLPFRDQYYGDAWRITNGLTSVRLRFRSVVWNGDSARLKSHYLVFMVTEPADSSADVRAVTRIDRNARQ